MRQYLKQAQKESLQLLDKAAEICEKHQIPYTLYGLPVWQIYYRNGNIENSNDISIAMFYDAYKSFIDVCKKELDGTEFYIMDSSNTLQFEEFYVRMAKRSRVILNNSRKFDESYYDFYINIIPIYYAGNTKRELYSLRKMYKKNYIRIHTKKLAPDTLKLSNCLKKLKSYLNYRNKTGTEYRELQEALSEKQTPVKYVLPPVATRLGEYAYLYETYCNTVQVDFMEKKYSCISKQEEWCKAYFRGNIYKEKIKNFQLNDVQLEGPEILRRVQLVETELLLEFDRICKKNNIHYILGAGSALGAVRHKGFIPWDDDIDVFLLYEEYKKFLEVANQDLDHSKYFLKTQNSDKDSNLVYVQLKRNGTVYTKNGRDDFDTHPGILIDIFPIFDAPNSRLKRKLQDIQCKFLKTMTWAHMGAESEQDFLKRLYYRLLAKVSNKKSYEKFLNCALRYQKADKPSEFLSYFFVRRNYPQNPVNQRKLYTEVIEMEFEGHLFPVTKYWKEYLSYTYSEDYMKYPLLKNRTQKHHPAKIDVGNLYSYEKARR